MGLDFDAIDYCRTLARSKPRLPPPYKCPVEKCGKSYQSIYGLQYHLVNYDHNNPQQQLMPIITPIRKKGRKHCSVNALSFKKSASQSLAFRSGSPPKEGLIYLEALKLVQFDLDGKSIKVSCVDEIPMITLEAFNEMVAKGECAPHIDVPPQPHIKLPEASVKKLESYVISDAPPRPNAYIRFIEKSAEELDGEVEYDIDEEDFTWLTTINERRSHQGLSEIPVDTLELLMDRLEKESYFQAAANGQSGSVVDDDAVCCICLDGECQNTNVILFCDMCNLAVHQDCYGVPYIPEGQWLCRRCLQSPSRPVDCVLCPNTGGAFKQTDHSQWAHVVCALWIPEVRFANTVFLEPIDSIEMIPGARWRLVCYICKQKGVGACIQCQRNNCYSAFHVTCAQQAGLHMRMETVNDNTNEQHPIIVQKTAYCDAHTPSGVTSGSEGLIIGAGSGGKNDSMVAIGDDAVRQQSRMKMKQARKLLAKKRTSVPLILIPTIPSERLHDIGTLVNMQKKAQFLQRLIAYWTLKRQYRNGVPLLRRLQSQGQTHQTRGIEGSPNAKELYQQLKYWQCLRQDLERARLLCELVRKREKLKARLIRTVEQSVMMELNPLEAAMNKCLDLLESKDTSEIFGEPVDVNEVPDYMDVVKQPMDFSTMRLKLKSGLYFTLDDLENDFDLMIKNCLIYNNRDTIFYRAGIRMRDQGFPIIKSIRRELEQNGLIDVQQSDESVLQDIEGEFQNLQKMDITEMIVNKLQLLLDKAQLIKHGGIRKTRCIKHLRNEIMKTKKILLKNNNNNDDDDDSKMDTSTISNSIINDNNLNSNNNSIATHSIVGSTTILPNVIVNNVNNNNNNTNVISITNDNNNNINSNNVAKISPTGVNRRTAVLFTRKAQAALRRPEMNMQINSLQFTNDNKTQIAAPSPSSSTSLTQPVLLTSLSTLTTTTTSNIGGMVTALSTTAGTNTTASAATSASTIPTTNTNMDKSQKGQQHKKGTRTKRNNNSHRKNSLDNFERQKSPTKLSNHNLLSLNGNHNNTILSNSSEIPANNIRSISSSNHLTNQLNYNNKSPSTTTTTQPVGQTAAAGQNSTQLREVFNTDSFRVYRGHATNLSDSDSQLSFSGSSCSSCSNSSNSLTGSDSGSSDEDDEDDDDDEDDADNDDDEDDDDDDDDEEDDDDEDDNDNEDDDGDNDEDDNDDVDDDNEEDGDDDDDDAKPSPFRKYNEKMLMHAKDKYNKKINRIVKQSIKNSNNNNNNNNNNTVRNKVNSKNVKTKVKPNETIVRGGNKTKRRNNNNTNNNTRRRMESHNEPEINSEKSQDIADEDDDDDDDDDDEDDGDDGKTPQLEPLQLVWAKCRGYPWYPALIIDPKIPKGYVYNGVPLPAPPLDVLALRKDKIEPVFLVLFFDTKRTWQWLEPSKLELLGVDKDVDERKMGEGKKASEKKAVRIAYKEAMHYQSQVTDLDGQGPGAIM